MVSFPYEGIKLGFAPNFKWDATAYTANVYRDLQGSHSSKGKIVYVVGKPCNIYYDNYRISLQSVNITGFPHNIQNLSL